MQEDQRPFGVWSRMSKRFVFGIAEKTRKMAFRRLQARIGSDAYKPRFEFRRIDNKNR